MKHTFGGKVTALAQLGASLAVIATASMVMAPTPALAQAASSTLRGQAKPGVEVVATAVDTGSVRRTTASADGTYVIAGLQPGNYHVTAGDQATDVIVSVASTSVVDLNAPATAQGEIVVTGARQTSEVHTSQVNQFVTLHDIAALPQVTRNFLEFADTVPGVQFSVDANHNTSLRGGAQLAAGVNVYIDGISQKDLVGGGSGITGSAGAQGNGDPGNPFPQLAIAEYKVVTSNYSAEYGDASSAIIIAQTKSGTNEFHAEAFGDFTNQKLRAKTPSEKATNTAKAKEPSWEYGVAIGGPIIKDVAHFFFTWEHKSLSNQANVFPGSGITEAEASALLPADVASQYGPVTNPFTENLYFGKVDLEPTDKDRIEVTAKWRLEHSISGGSGQAAASTEAPYRNNDKRADIRWQHNEDHWINEALLSYQNTNSSTTTTKASPQIQYQYFPNAANSNGSIALIQVGGPGSGIGAINAQKGWTFKDNFTLPNIQLAGDHTFRAGFSFGSIKLTSQNASSDLANATYYYAVTPAGLAATPYKLQFPNLTAGFDQAGITTRDKQYSAYVQDDWNVNRHLTINLGVRMDYEVVPAYLDFETPANVLAALNSPFPGTTQSYASVLAMGNGSLPGYDINDYISNGHNRKAPKNFSPRLGFSYDLGGDNKHVFFGGYARAYNRNQFATLALETTKIALNGNPEVYFPSAQTQDAFGPCATAADINPANHCYAFDPSYLTPTGLAGFQTDPTSHEVDLLHNNIKTPYSDQFSLGMRNKIGEWNTQVSASYIESFDNIVGRLGNRYSDGAYFHNGSQWGGQGVPGVGGLILWDNGTKDHLWQLGVGAQKPYTKTSGWSATFSYTLSVGKQNNLAGGSNPYQINNNQYLFDLPYANEYPTIQATAVPRHRIVATYTRDLFWGISGATKVELATPTAAAWIFGCPAGVSVCNDYGGSTIFGSSRPHNTLGYKDVDLQLSKDITFVGSLAGYFRVDVLNVFNWHNFNPGDIAVNGDTHRATYNKQGNIVGTPRMIKLTAGLRF
jgi:outer membrane receptor protein involved in Fe transport